MRSFLLLFALFIVTPHLDGQVTDKDAKRVVLPSLEFNVTPLRDVLEFLQQRTAELREESVPDPVPQTQIIKDVSFPTLQRNGAGDTRVTFHARNITVWDALIRVLTPLDLEIAVDEAGHMTVEPKAAPK